MDKDECASGPCLNSGICTNLINSFSCQCFTGFEGTLCEINKNECLSNPCQNGGECVDGIGQYRKQNNKFLMLCRVRY